MTSKAGSGEMMKFYSLALDRVYALRVICAVEAELIKGHVAYATFPKSRREFAAAQVVRLRRAARGEANQVVMSLSGFVTSAEMASHGVPARLTPEMWEAGRELGDHGYIADPDFNPRLYELALIEISSLQKLLLYDARTLEAHHEGVSSFPKTAKKIAVEQSARMRLAGSTAHKAPKLAYAVSSAEMDAAMAASGASTLMTRFRWEAQQAVESFMTRPKRKA